MSGDGGKAMEEMGRIHGSGTYDHSTKKWKLRTKELTASATISQLSERYGVPIPDDERKSRPFWTRYLAELRTKTATSTEQLRDAIRQLIGVPEYPPAELVPLVNATIQGNYTEVKKMVQPAPTKEESLKEEVRVFIERHKARGNKQWYSTKAYLELFLEAAGDISLKDISVQHYRRFLELVDGHKTWGEVTKIKAQQQVHTFLKRVEADHGYSFGFIRNPDYKRQMPDGEKVQWTLEQVQTALKHADGIARTALLLGLNAGFYYGDITELQADHFDGTHLNKPRAKNKGRRSPFVGSWKLWPETVEVLKYGLTKREVYREFQKLRDKYGLPEHKGLRKTVAQLIQDNQGDEASRLYRAEKVAGTHGRNYIAFSTAQRAKLDAALDAVRSALFGQKK